MWASLVLVLCLAWGELPRVALGGVAAGAVLVVTVGCLGRVYLGEHWPSDVIGGLALGLGWTSLAVGVRRLSDPIFAPEAFG